MSFLAQADPRRAGGGYPAGWAVQDLFDTGRAWFIKLAWSLWRERTPRRAAVLFHYSPAYLALLFVAMAVDVL